MASLYDAEDKQPCRVRPSAGSKGQLLYAERDIRSGEGDAVLPEAGREAPEFRATPLKRSVRGRGGWQPQKVLQSATGSSVKTLSIAGPTSLPHQNYSAEVGSYTFQINTHLPSTHISNHWQSEQSFASAEEKT